MFKHLGQSRTGPAIVGEGHEPTRQKRLCDGERRRWRDSESNRGHHDFQAQGDGAGE
jgi:hypothetical protein